jgi:hypothetical protein
MKSNYLSYLLIFILAISYASFADAQSKPDLFVNDWKAKTMKNPVGINTLQTEQIPTVVITINATDTINKVSKYLFGGNLNPYSPLFKKDSVSLRHLKNLNTSVLRWPGGNLSNDYFWNAKTKADLPDDLPGTKYWLGSDPLTKDAITPDYYKTLKETNSTGCICVNYSYARYGLSKNSVQRAAHLAAEWVRYDKGRTRFWEIGNENYGNWQSGYEIDPTKYTDGRPRFISGAIYGEHCLVFIDSMRAAAAEVGAEIYIGVQAWEDYTSWDPIQTKWNDGLFPKVGNKADFIIIHNYYTPYQTNSTIPVIWKSLDNTAHFVEVLNSMVKKYALKPIPLALTEYNMQGQDSAQTISYINGMHAVMVLADAMKYGFGMAERWSTVGFWGGVGDLGTFSYAGEPNVPEGSLRPEFYYLYYMQKYFGDIMVKTTANSADIASYATTFSSGQSGIMLLNKSKSAKTVSIKLNNFRKGAKYHRYVLTGGTDNGSFSGRVYVNGEGPMYVKGGPADKYELIKPYSTDINGEIVLDIPRYGTVFLVVEGENRPEYQSSKIENSSSEIFIKLNMAVSDTVSSNGFSVKVNDTVNVAVTHVERSAEDEKTVVLTLGRAILKTENVRVTYNNGTIKTTEGQNLVNFENQPVDNLLAGAEPKAKDAQASGKKVVEVHFTRNLEKAVSKGLKVILTSQANREIAIDSCNFAENNASKLILTLADSLNSYDKLKLQYADTTLKSDDGTKLQPFEISVLNQVSPETPNLLSAKMDATGYEISLFFDQMMSDATLQKPWFKVEVDGNEAAIQYSIVAGGQLKLSLLKAIDAGTKVNVSYSGGSWTSFAGVKVSDFEKFNVPNNLVAAKAHNLPGTIQAEDFAVNVGTQTENTGDTGGGKNVGYIDSGDWLEYMVDVSVAGKYKLTFRVAANTSAGQIDVFAPGQVVEKLGTVAIPITGGWQKWVSVSTSVNLVAGKQRLRLTFAKGGCNFNWVQAEREIPSSINELGINESLTVFPNPASEQITIQSTGFSFSQVKILDLTGKALFEQIFPLSNSMTVKLPALVNGCYILELNNKNQKTSKILMINDKK